MLEDITHWGDRRLSIPQLRQIDDTDIWATAGFAIAYGRDGTIRSIYTDFFDDTDLFRAITFGIVEDDTSPDWKQVAVIAPFDGSSYRLSFERKMTSGTGKSGSLRLDEIRKEGDMILWDDDGTIYSLFDLQSPAVREAIATHPQCTRLSRNLYKVTYRESKGSENDVTLLFQFTEDRLTRIFKPLGTYAEDKVTPDLRIVGTTRVPYSDLKPDYFKGKTVPALIVQNKWAQFVISSKLGGGP
jgi:hypothetical protein